LIQKYPNNKYELHVLTLQPPAVTNYTFHRTLLSALLEKYDMTTHINIIQLFKTHFYNKTYPWDALKVLSIHVQAFSAKLAETLPSRFVHLTGAFYSQKCYLAYHCSICWKQNQRKRALI